MKYELEIYNRNVPDEHLLDDLKAVAKKLGRSSVTHEEYNKNGKYNSTTYMRRFGGWFKSLEMAGLQKTRTPANVSEDDLFNNIEEIWIKLGRQPRYQEVRTPLSKYCAGTYENRFGTWRKALEAFIDYINKDQDKCSNEISQKEIKSGETSKSNKHIKMTKREISDRLRFRILLRDGFTCRKCGRSPLKNPGIELHVDHILPWSKGGETTIENLETKCEKCNLGKGNAFDV
ncbi:MAG: HNH endonuclease [Candidatus Saganbacteria bacterium]|nr:HNH endonuclease [Candidatus Saganbacteria bacterium]